MSKFWLSLAAILAAGSLTAELIGPVEYNLPDRGNGWMISRELHGKKGKRSQSKIYEPESTEGHDPNEFFLVHLEYVKADLNDIAAIKKSVQANFPNQKTWVTVLEKSPNSIFYEWGVEENDHKVLNGITRVITSPSETVLLSYQTGQVDKPYKVPPNWTKAIKDAKLVNPS